MSLVQNRTNPAGYKADVIKLPQIVLTASNTPTFRMDIAQFDLGVVKVNGVTATANSEYSITASTITPIGGTIGDVYTFEFVISDPQVRS